MIKKTEKELRDLLAAFSEGLAYWQVSISTPENISQIKSATVNEPISEFVKVCKLIHAHTTKLGIIFKPAIDANAAYNTLKESSEKFLLLISLVGQLDGVEHSEILVSEILMCVKNILLSTAAFVKELEELEFDNDEDQGDGRLVSVGKIWDNCDNLMQICEKGKIGVLSVKVKQSVSMIEDGLEEVQEWLENPEEFDDEDPFGLNDDFGEEDDEEEKEIKVIDEEFKKYAEKWVQKIKLIKLLLSSLIKSIPKKVTGLKINEINSYQKNFVTNIDELIVAIMMNCNEQDCEPYTELLLTESKELIKLVKNLNNGDEKKTKWCDVWQTKFLENLN